MQLAEAQPLEMGDLKEKPRIRIMVTLNRPLACHWMACRLIHYGIEGRKLKCSRNCSLVQEAEEQLFGS